MSIFKESFRDYVKKQLELRQAIISIGNDGKSRYNAQSLKFSKAAGSEAIVIPYGSFYANTLNRTCVIRMSSGVDLTQAGVYNILDAYELSQGITAGSDLAKLYILEGGVPNVGNNHNDINTLNDKNDPTLDWLINAKPKSGWTNAVNRKNTAYGDALTRSNASVFDKDYGIVPMPGIIDIQVKTKSAYGSIREAKVNFKCHNQRQLEILELLYMRPGVPILLEWGWTTYVNNKGKLITNESLPIMDEFWNSTGQGGMNLIYRKIIDNKEKAGGNYDGLMGMCKNFSFKARKDGGFDCSTELTAMGEIIESLKGRSGTPSFTNKVLAPFTVNTGTDDEKPNEDKEVAALGKLYDKFKPDEGDLDAIQLILIDLQGYLLMSDEVLGYTDHFKNKDYSSINMETADKIYDLWKNGSDNNKEFVKDYRNCLERTLKYFDLDSEHGSTSKMDNTLQTDYITNFLLHHGNRSSVYTYDHEDVLRSLDHYEKEVNDGKLNDITWIGAGWKTGFIKWEAFAYLLNKYAITPLAKDKTAGDEYDEQKDNEPIIKIATKYIENEDKNPGGTLGGNTDARLRPYQYAEVPMKDWSNGSKYDSMQDGYSKFWNTPADLCDRSFDHSVCFLPHGCSDFGGMHLDDSTINYPPFDLMYLSSPNDPKRHKVREFIIEARKTTYEGGETGGLGLTNRIKKEEQLRSIGNIMFNIDHLINTYQKMAYDKSSDTYIRKDDFNIYRYIERIWDDVNRATGGAHKFIPQVDHEKPDIIRIVDMQITAADLPDPDAIHTMNIQGNNTIVRDFTYNSLIPSALSATIGIAMQNPDSIEDLDGATFAAMAKNIKSRFVEDKNFRKDRTGDDLKKQIKKWKERYEKRADQIEELTFALSNIGAFKRIGYGQTKAGDREVADGRGFDEPFDVSSGPTKQKSLYKNILRIMNYHDKDGEYDSGEFAGSKYYKGQPKPEPKMPNASSVIPLKFNAKMDGIGGIVIGNVFQIDPTRLPIGYKESDVAFVVTGETQKVTSGQDWTTTINGQLTLLPFTTQPSNAKLREIVDGKGSTNEKVNPTTKEPAQPAAGITKLSELKNTVDGDTGTELTPIKDLLSDLEGTDGPYPYGVYNYGKSSQGKHPCSAVMGSKANKDALGKPPINTLTMREIIRRQALPPRIADSDGCVKDTKKSGRYADNMDLNGCQIFAAGKYQIIPKTMTGSTLSSQYEMTDIFDGAMQEKLGDILLLEKRSRLSAYLKGTNTGTEQDLINAVNEAGWEWASVPIINFAGKKYATACGETMSSVMGDVKTGTGNHGNYCDDVNKSAKKTFVKNVVINLIHSRWQLAGKLGNAQKPAFQPDFMLFDLENGDTLKGSKQVGKG